MHTPCLVALVGQVSSAVMFSGGAASYIAAKRWRDKDPDAVLLFSDTGIEDADLYRFLNEASEHLGMRLVTVQAGESFEEMIAREKALPNNMMPFCSRVMKTEPAERWLMEHPEVTTLVYGLEWTETHRVARIAKRWPGYTCVFPAMERPMLFKAQMLDEIRSDGIEPPRLYSLGFAHNNCGGGCVRNGHAAWRHLAAELPERFAWWVELERKHGKGKHTFAKDRRNGESKPITLTDLVACDGLDLYDFGGCGCFLD